MIDFQEATQIILKQTFPLSTEKIRLENAIGRILSENIKTDRNYPPFNRATMDGFAFRFDDLQHLENQSFEIIETIYPAQKNQRLLAFGQAYKIMTGASVPSDADTVIQVERCKIQGNKVYFESKNLQKGQFIAQIGEDAMQNITLSENPLRIDMPTATTLANLGYAEVRVFKHPTVNIVSTGNEIVRLGMPTGGLQIRNSNYFSLRAGLQKLGIMPQNYALVGDDFDALKITLQKSLMTDILIVTGAVSRGDADFVPQILAQLGAQKLFHRVAIKPGKPLWFGTRNQTVIFALPGNPLSTQVNFRIFVQPFLHQLFGVRLPLISRLKLESKAQTHPKLDLFCPAIYHQNAHQIALKKFKGSGDVTASLHTNGIAHLPKNQGVVSEIDFYHW